MNTRVNTLRSVGQHAATMYYANMDVRAARDALKEAEWDWCRQRDIDRSETLDATTYAEMKANLASLHEAVAKAKAAHYNAKRRFERAAGNTPREWGWGRCQLDNDGNATHII